MRRDAAACLAQVLNAGTPVKLGPAWQRAVAALLRASRSRDPDLVAAAMSWAILDPAVLKRQIQLLRSDREVVRVAAYKALDGQQFDRRWSPQHRALIAGQLRPTP